MARISGNENFSIRYFVESSTFLYWVLDSGATCYMTPQVSDFIPGLLEDHINIWKLRMGIMSWRSKKYKFK